MHNIGNIAYTSCISIKTIT